MGKVIGIDLGTTNSCVSAMIDGEVKVIANVDGNRTTPSIVGFTKDGERVVGDAAKRQAVTNPENTIYSVKRFMGRRFDEVNEEQSMISYKIKSGAGNAVKIEADGKEYAPQEISAIVLQYLKGAAEDYLGEKVTQAVITVPAYFNDEQRQATKDAGKIAGLEVLRIINEPTAASLAYGLDKKNNEKIAIYDLGGGTFDVSILEIGDGVFEVLSTNGDTHLGGDNVDHILIDYIADEFKKAQGVDLRADKMSLQRVREAAEQAKKDLSGNQQVAVNLPFITANASGPLHLDMTITRAKFEDLIGDLVERSMEPCRIALKDSGLSASEIDEVLLVGGSTRIPLVAKKVEEFFGKAPNKGVNPDEAVAVGAGVQGAVLAGDESVKDVLLLDVTPLSLGIETMGGVNTKIIEKNSTIPVKKSQVFSTAADNQTAVTIHVLQGERAQASQNRTLGDFNLVDIPAAPRGVPQIEVTFDIDANGILHVTAKDKGTGKEQKIKIESSSGLSDEEVEKMVKDAEANAAEDEKFKEAVDAKNQAEQAIFQTEKTLKEHGDKVSDEDKAAIEAAKADLQAAIDANDIDAMKEKQEALMQASHKLAEEVYKNMSPEEQAEAAAQAQAAAGGADAGAGASADSDADDADYEIIDDEDEKK